ncbi:MAG TPA: GAF domain-containing protein [Mycobacteriales bacterium]|nr:GAF domain-containing protein [Mycobacteriales bacterium]
MIDGQRTGDAVNLPSQGESPVATLREQMLREEIGRRERWLVAAGEITTALLAGGASERVLPMIAMRARELAGADCALLLVPERGSGQSSLVVAAISAADELQPESLLGTRVPVAGSVCGLAFRDGVSMQVDDLFRSSPPAALAGAAFGPAVAVPLASKGATLGALMVARVAGGATFSAESAAVTESFAVQAALALHLAESQRTERRLARLEDRERIAVDLQDNLIQRLFAIGMLLETVSRRLESADLRARLDHAAHELDATIKQTRETIHSLQASADEDHPELRQRLLAAVEEATACTTVNPSVRLDGPLDALVPPEIADGAVEIVREAVSDVVRRGASTVAVTVVASDTLAVTVCDDVEDSPTGDWLRDLSDQAAGFGGELTVAADPAAGRRLIWQVPLC